MTDRTRNRRLALVAGIVAVLSSPDSTVAGLPPTPTFTVTPPVSFTASGGPTPTLTPTAPPSPFVTPTATFTPPVLPGSPTATLTIAPTSPPPTGGTPVFTASPVVTPTPTTPTPSPGGTPCGNFALDPGETCDPPGSLQPPNNTPCRADCTYCGDTITQSGAGETCDDGNSVSGCVPNRPQQALDSCLNNCTFPICEDPSRIQLFPDSNDVVQVHGRLIAPLTIDFESGDFTVRISRRVCTHDTSIACSGDEACDALSAGSLCTPDDPASLVFEQSIAGSAIDGNGKRWKYRNPAAKTAGGLYGLKITAKTKKKICAGGSNSGTRCTTAAECPQGSCVGYYVLKLKAYGTANAPVADMQTRITGGGFAWAVRGIWQQLPKSWRLYKKSELLDPWL